MADNTTLNPGAGGDLVAADDIGGVKFQRVKVTFGDDGFATDASTAAPLPVTLSATGPAVTAINLTNTSIGGVADIAATADTGSFSINALVKRGLANWTALLARIPALVGGRTPVDGSGVTQPVAGTRLNNGTANAAGALHLTVGGTDGTNLRPMLLDTSGRAIVSVNNMVAQGLTDTQLRASALAVTMSNTLALTDVQLRATAVPISMPSGFISTANSGAVPLGINGVFTGPSEDVTDYADARVIVFADQASAVDGLQIQQSSNGTSWDISDNYTIPAGSGKTFSVGISAKFFRVVYTNGAVAQTAFRLQSKYQKSYSKGSSVRPQDGRANDNDMEEQLGHLMGYNGASWDRLRSTVANGLAVDVTRISGAVSLPTGASTETTLAALNAKIPASPATEGGNLATLVARTPALGAATVAASSPVTMPNHLSVGAAASIAALNIDLISGVGSGWYDAANFSSASIQVIGSAGITAGAITFEQTNDTTAASAGNVWAVEETTGLTPTPNIAAITIAASTIRMFAGQVTARYVRARVSTAFATANVQAVAVFSQLPYQRTVQTIHQPTAASLNVTVAGTVTANQGTMVALPAGTNAVGDVGTQYRANATGAASVVSVQSPITPAAATIKASAGRLIGWQLQNSSAAIRSVKLFNATAPTLGTTAAVFEFDIPAGGSIGMDFEGGIGFATAITYSVTSAKGLIDNTATGLAINDVSGLFAFA